MKDKLYKLKIDIVEYIYLKLFNEINYRFRSSKNKMLKSEKNKIILTLLPNHGNLGDHAIAYASYKFLKDNFENYDVIQVDMIDIYKYGKAIKNSLKKGDFIAIIGGGNMNNLYRNEEWTRRFIIREFNNIPIISLPQTIAFTEDIRGRRELNKTKKIYTKNDNLTIFAREDKSFEVMKRVFNNNKVIKNPDMVFYLANLNSKTSVERSGILTCLRQDKEGYIGEENRIKIINNLKKDYKNVEITDTVIQKNVSLLDRDEELNNIWNKFSTSEIVITDRLHGMIFAVITQTPCIVIRNTDHKIIESYKWIKDLNYIKLIDDFSYENINNNIQELLKLKKLDYIDFKNKYFNQLKKHIVESI